MAESSFLKDDEWERAVSGPAQFKYESSKTQPFKKYSESFVGRWLLTGTKAIDNIVSRKILCKSCFVLEVKKEFYNVGEETEFEWSNSVCENEDCWGARQERYLQVKRQYRKYKDFTGWEYLISNHKVMLHGLSEEVLDRTFVKMHERRPGTLEGIGIVQCKANQIPMFGFPKLIDFENSKQSKASYYLHLTMAQNQQSDFCHGGQPNKPYPLIMIAEHFKQNSENSSIPQNWSELAKFHFPVALSHLEMYPFGAGLRQVQFKYMVNESMKGLDQNDWLNFQAKPSNEKIDFFKGRDWSTEYKKYFDQKSAFWENFQNGWGGPVVSFYRRHDEINAWFQ